MLRSGNGGFDLFGHRKAPIHGGSIGVACLAAWIAFLLCPCTRLEGAPAGSIPAVDANLNAPADALHPVSGSPPAENEKAAENPLEKFVRGLFNRPWPNMRFGRKPAARVARRQQDGAEDDDEAGTTDRDAIDARAPHDAKIEQQLKTAQAVIRQGDWKQAVPLLQKLLDLSEDSLYRLPDRRWQSVRATANRLLGEMPPAVLEEYQQQNGGLASTLLSEAWAEGDVQQIVQVANRFFHTQAGQQAANWLIDVHWDHAEFGVATLWIENLLSINAKLTKSQTWKLRALAISQQAGRTDLVRKLRAGLDPSQQSLRVKGDSVALQSWLQSMKSPDSNLSKVEGEWRMLNGTSDRRGIQSGSAPFLRPVWQVPYSYNFELCRRIERLIQDLNDQGRPTVLAAQPLAVNGKVIYRDLRGVRAVDLETGKGIWESIEGLSAERILTGTAGNHPFDGTETMAVLGRDGMETFDGQQSEFHPLTSLLLRDAAYQLLSSDGQQVFLLEDQGILSKHQPGFQWGWDGEEDDPYGFSWTTNRLSSYDVETGQLLWTVGGPETSESFQLPLAGVYFHGAPTPDGDDLFVIGTRGDEVRLWCLDRRTGGLVWSQLIAFADAKIDQDIGRRWMAALPSVSDGVVVCPTTLGWLVAIDRLRHSVLWAVRYSPPGPAGEMSAGSNLVAQQELGDGWGPAAPIVADSSVVYAPPEDELLVCVDLLTGKRRWQLDRDEGQELLGIHQKRVIVTSLDSIAAYSLRDGKPIWTCPFNKGARPSGRSVLTTSQALIPLNDGELWAVSLDKGRSQRMLVPDQAAPLGNLVMHRGMVAALGAKGLIAFRQEATLWEEFQRRGQENRDDSANCVIEAEIHLLHNRMPEALAILRAVSLSQLAAEDRSRARQDLILALSSVIRQKPQESESELDEFARLAESANEQLLHLELSAERLWALNRHAEAFRLYWQLRDKLTGEPIPRQDNPEVRVNRLEWLQGRLNDTWSAAGREQRILIDEIVREAVETSASESADDRKVLAGCLKFHPAAVPLIQQLIEENWKSNSPAEKELQLLRLSESSDWSVAAWAVWKLGVLMDELGLPGDAEYWHRRLETRFESERMPAGETVAKIAEDLRQRRRNSPETGSPPVSWSDGPLRAIRSVVQSLGQPEQEVVLASPSPWLSSLDVELLPQENRLRFHARQVQGFEWQANLRTSSHPQHNQFVSTAAVGHCVAVVHQDVLHVLAPLQKQSLWSRVLSGWGEGALAWQASARTRSHNLWSVSQDADSGWSLLQQANTSGRLAVAQAGYLAVHGRRAIEVVDPLTGRELWRRERILPQTRVVGSPEAVWLVSPDAGQSQVYRATDGALLRVKNPGELLAKAVCFVGNDLLLADRGPGIRFFAIERTQTVLRRYNPFTETEVWQLQFGPRTQLTLLNEQELLVTQPTGAVQLVDMETGSQRALDSLSQRDLQHAGDCFAIQDDERLYLVVNRQDSSNYYNFGESFATVPAHGAVFAWQKSTGKFLWKQAIARQHLVLDHFQSSPLLVFCTREWKQKGNANFSLLHLMAVQKQSGKIQHDSSVPTMHNSFHSVGISFTEPSVELKAHNLRIKLVPAHDAPTVPKTN